jgi:hypothetical protein
MLRRGCELKLTDWQSVSRRLYCHGGTAAAIAQRDRRRNGQQSGLSRRSLPILPFAEIYTVIDLVSIDSRGGWREGPVHLEGHRLVHDRLVS